MGGVPASYCQVYIGVHVCHQRQELRFHLPFPGAIPIVMGIASFCTLVSAPSDIGLNLANLAKGSEWNRLQGVALASVLLLEH